MPERRSSVRRLCQQFARLRASAVAAPDVAALEALVTAARDGADIEEGRAALAERLGVSDPPRGRTITGVFGLDGGHTEPDLYVCPAGLCSRTWLNVPGKGAPPRCAITDAVLVRE
ncbi:hypothetical protein [Streptosporangium sp. NPDC002721]|uniref:hypothetical protein n=1 Tax=Streptosporangium sp. NPDC002721 TaxID=3366188 RepID=UPI00367DC9E1